MKLEHILNPNKIIDVSYGIRINKARRLKPGTKVKYLNEDLTVKTAAFKDSETNLYLLPFYKKNGKIWNMPILPPKKFGMMTPGQKEEMRKNIKMVVEQYKEQPKRLIDMAQNYYNNFTQINNYQLPLIKQLMRIFPIDILKSININS